jgi:hypothetical protein
MTIARSASVFRRPRVEHGRVPDDERHRTLRRVVGRGAVSPDARGGRDANPNRGNHPAANAAPANARLHMTTTRRLAMTSRLWGRFDRRNQSRRTLGTGIWTGTGTAAAGCGLLLAARRRLLAGAPSRPLLPPAANAFQGVRALGPLVSRALTP